MQKLDNQGVIIAINLFCQFKLDIISYYVDAIPIS
jgi:hypothetical protein